MKDMRELNVTSGIAVMGKGRIYIKVMNAIVKEWHEWVARERM